MSDGDAVEVNRKTTVIRGSVATLVQDAASGEGIDPGTADIIEARAIDDSDDEIMLHIRGEEADADE